MTPSNAKISQYKQDTLIYIIFIKFPFKQKPNNIYAEAMLSSYSF